MAPLKIVTIPRLELAATELLSQLITVVRDSMELRDVPYVLWTDNTIALHWINKPVHVLRLIVANRVARIQALTDVKSWRHIRTHENPADLISRGLHADELVDKSLWWFGPQWLCKSESEWPKAVEIRALQQPPAVCAELKVQAVSKRTGELEIFVRNYPETVYLFDYTKNLGEIKRILTYARRFISNCLACVRKKRSRPEKIIDSTQIKENLREYVPFPTDEEQNEAIKSFIRREQLLHYPKECAYFTKKTKLPIQFPEGSKLTNLHPQLDKDGLLRVGGRLSRAELPFDTRHPIIIPPRSRLSRAIILEAHRKTGHGGTQLMLQYIRNMYWIPRLRVEIKGISMKCTTCTRFDKKPATQLMAELPADRVRQFRAFRNSGVDYAGPFLLKDSNKRGAKTQKCWIAVFVCMCTRAVHLDVVTSLSSAAFISCDSFRVEACVRAYTVITAPLSLALKKK